MKWFTPDEVATQLSVVKSTVIGLCEDGLLPAVNVARKSSVRKRWRISERDLVEFQQRRCNEQPTAITKSSGRTIDRPKKDFFSGVSR